MSETTARLRIFFAGMANHSTSPNPARDRNEERPKDRGHSRRRKGKPLGKVPQIRRAGDSSSSRGQAGAAPDCTYAGAEIKSQAVAELEAEIGPHNSIRAIALPVVIAGRPRPAHSSRDGRTQWKSS
jgi:hypothetical protein